MTASAQRAAEPSMEEILASIRRIIADDKSRTRIGQAKLVSVPEPASEKPRAEEHAAEPPDAGAEPVRLPMIEAQTFGEGREAFSVHQAEMPRSIESPAPEPALPLSANLAEEGAPAQPSPNLQVFGAGGNSLGALPPHAHALSMPPSNNAAGGSEPPAARGLLRESSIEDVAERAPQSARESESGDEWDADAALSRVFSPEPGPEPGRQVPQPEPDPELASPSPRLAQACAEDREATRLSELAGSRLHSRTQEAAAILSSETDRAVTRAFGDLNRGVLSENVRSLEDVVKEMLRPLLKSWLDDNLPRIVERLVRMEIERVARGRPE